MHFSRHGVYGKFGHGYRDNWERFAFFCRVAIDISTIANNPILCKFLKIFLDS
ncbi:MAG: glycogen/starch synthase [Puniceicoccales bacterium]|nr:glycogen/starch synthase [Puniceicoccales bacterium]